MRGEGTGPGSHSPSVTEPEGTQALALLHHHDSYTQSRPSPPCVTAWHGEGPGDEVLERGWGGVRALIPVAPSPRDPWPLDYPVHALGRLGQHCPQHGGARGTSRARCHSQHSGRCGDHSDGQLSARSDPRHHGQPHPCLLLHPGRCGCGPGGLHCLQEVRGGHRGQRAGPLLSRRALL